LPGAGGTSKKLQMRRSIDPTQVVGTIGWVLLVRAEAKNRISEQAAWDQPGLMSNDERRQDRDRGSRQQ